MLYLTHCEAVRANQVEINQPDTALHGSARFQIQISVTEK